MKEVLPLPHEWMIVSIIGFFVSWLYIYGELGWQNGVQVPIFIKWGATFMIFFAIMFVAVIVNMSKASTDEHTLGQLAVHEIRKRK